jgi:hypothetical protein
MSNLTKLLRSGKAKVNLKLNWKVSRKTENTFSKHEKRRTWFYITNRGRY